MGCGKSSVGRELSELLCCPFMDLDKVIEESAGRTIPEIFSQDGEPAFRQMELETLQTIVSSEGSKTESLPRLRRGPLPFTRPRAATVFDTPTADNTQSGMSLPYNRQTAGKDTLYVEKADREGLVLALGGGAVMTRECEDIVHEKTLCVYLKASVETLLEHLEGEAEGRPMLRAEKSGELRERIENLMTIRSATYERTAHIIIDTDGKSIDEIAMEIKEAIQL